MTLTSGTSRSPRLSRWRTAAAVAVAHAALVVGAVGCSGAGGSTTATSTTLFPPLAPIGTVDPLLPEATPLPEPEPPDNANSIPPTTERSRCASVPSNAEVAEVLGLAEDGLEQSFLIGDAVCAVPIGEASADGEVTFIHLTDPLESQQFLQIQSESGFGEEFAGAGAPSDALAADLDAVYVVRSGQVWMVQVLVTGASRASMRGDAAELLTLWVGEP